MNVLKPSFYDNFKCIADACTYSCCIDWEIDVDISTYQKYQELGESHLVDCNKENGNIQMRLTSDGKCPFLEDSGLCRLVLQYGETVLSCTCDKFPRSCAMGEDGYEQFLSNACPEVLNLLWDIPTPLPFVLEEAPDSLLVTRQNYHSEYVDSRNALIDILQCNELPLWERLIVAYQFSRKIGQTQSSRDSIIQLYTTLEFLVDFGRQLDDFDWDLEYKREFIQELWKRINTNFSNYFGYKKYIKDLFEICDGLSYREDFKSLWNQFESLFCSYDGFWENVCVNNIYTNGALVKGVNSFENNCILMVFEYALVKFTLFLMWLYEKEMPDKIDIITGTSYYARLLEHNGEKVTEFIEEMKQQEYLGLGDIYNLVC